MTRPTLGSVELQQSTFAGFDYPAHVEVVPILGDGVTPGGNAVLQSSALTVRQAAIAWTSTDPTDVATIRGYYENLTPVTYTEHDGSTDHDVYVIAFAASSSFHDVWECTATLVEAP